MYYRSFNFRDLISQCNNCFECEACDVICDEKSISNGQSRYTGNIGHIRHKTKTIQIHWQHWTHKTQDKDNPDTLATLDTQDTGRRQTKHKNTTQKTKTMSNKDLTKNWE